MCVILYIIWRVMEITFNSYFTHYRKKMRNVIEYFDNICKNAEKANRKLAGSDQSTGYGNRFHKMVSKKKNRFESIGIYDSFTKKYVLFEMVNLVGQKDKIPQEFKDMEMLIKNAFRN